MQRYEKIPTVRMKTTNFIHRHWIMASSGLATDTRRTVCQGFVTAATNYRACCHELSHQLPRNIVPIATNDAQGMLTEPKDCLFETARTFSANAYKGGMEALCRRRGDPKPPSLGRENHRPTMNAPKGALPIMCSKACIRCRGDLLLRSLRLCKIKKGMHTDKHKTT